jgi:tetratricopeptide (TPR) repeat protein
MQARIDDMWDYDQPRESEERFRNAIENATSDSERLELKTQLARALGLQGRFEDAHRILDDVQNAIQMLFPNEAVIRVRYLLERGRLFNSAKRYPAALPLFTEAFERAEQNGNDHLAIDAAHMIAIAKGAVADTTGAEQWNQRALRRAESSVQPRARKWLGSLHNNMGWLLHDQGRFAEALTHFEQALMHRVASGTIEDQFIARWCIARCLRSQHRVDEALRMQREIAADRIRHGLQPDRFVEDEINHCLQDAQRTE